MVGMLIQLCNIQVNFEGQGDTSKFTVTGENVAKVVNGLVTLRDVRPGTTGPKDLFSNQINQIYLRQKSKMNISNRAVNMPTGHKGSMKLH